MRKVFKSKKEFAIAIAEKPWWTNNGTKVYFDENERDPFRILLNNRKESFTIESSWNQFKYEWTDHPPLDDLDLVMCWDNNDKPNKLVAIYDKHNNCLFNSAYLRNGAEYYNYEKIDPIPDFLKEWYEDTIQKIKENLEVMEPVMKNNVTGCVDSSTVELNWSNTAELSNNPINEKDLQLIKPLNLKDIDPEFNDIVNDEFWNLI